MKKIVRTLKKKLTPPNAKIIQISWIQRMFTIYSQKDIVHINKVSLGFFFEDNTTELQPRHN